jgi:4-hydroxy-tetrahydrodipicolinate reductase
VAEAPGLVVSGASGRMGGALARLARSGGGWSVVGGVGRRDSAEAGARDLFPAIVEAPDAAPLIAASSVLVDFSAPDLLRDILQFHGEALAGRPVVVGTTGLGDEVRALLDRQAERSPVLVAANFSVGVNVLLALAERAARALGDDYEIEIVEAHHRRKADAPSGTALALGEAVARARGVELQDVRRDGRSGRPGERPAAEIGFHSVRGGDVVGDHQLLFLNDLEIVELKHRATDRSLFAAGALRAASWLIGRPPGRYTLIDVLGLG